MASFLGRRQEIAQAGSVLMASRLTTLTGVGAVGKSRLALRVDKGVQRAFRGGACLAESAKLQSPTLVTTLAVELGLREQSTRGPETVVREFLSDELLLLALDSCAATRSAHSRESLGDEAFDDAYEAGRNMSLDAPIAYALSEGAKAEAAVASSLSSPLTRCEHGVAALVAKGFSDKKIAAKLFMAKRTFEARVEHVFIKLGFNSWTQLANWMTEQRTPHRSADVSGGEEDACRAAGGELAG